MTGLLSLGAAPSFLQAGEQRAVLTAASAAAAPAVSGTLGDAWQPATRTLLAWDLPDG